MMKKYFLILVIIFLLIFSYNCSSIMDIEPRELLILMDDKFICGNTSKKIILTNNEEYSVNFSWYLDNPDVSLIRENRTFIPDLSWVDLEPKWQNVDSGESALFYVYLKIPNNYKYLDEKWEIWATFRQNISTSTFKWEHAVRIYIDLPNEYNFFSNQNIIFYLAIISIMVFFALFVLFLIKKRKYST